MYTTTLKQAMPIVATALGRKFGVQVQVGGPQAATDGQTIWLPDLQDDSRLRPVAWGLLAHEASHVRHTDMAVFQAAGRHSPLRRALLNILEDIRIEHAIRRAYPGTEITLAQVIDWMLADGQLQPPRADDHPAHILTATLLLRLRHQVLGQSALAAPAHAAERVLRQTFPASLVHRWLGLLTEVRGLGSTAEAAALAERLEQWLVAETRSTTPTGPTVAETASNTGPADPVTTENDRGDGSAEGRDPVDQVTAVAPGDTADAEECAQMPAGNGTMDPDSARESGSATDGDPRGEPSGFGNPDSLSQSSSAGAANPCGAPDQEPVLSDPIQRTLAAGQDDLDGDLFESVRQALAKAAGPDTLGIPRLPVGEEARCDPRLSFLWRQRVEDTSRVLRTRLQGLVQASRMDRPSAARRGRRLLPRRLHRIEVGETRLFARRASRSAPNTALHLLVDLSGSMGNRTASGQPAFQVALESALAVSLALESIPGVSVAVTAFPGQHGDDGRVTRLVQHGQSVRQRADAFDQGPRGGTPLAQALWYAAADLLLRPEPRRVILVMTDGDPNDRAAAHAILDRCRGHGLESIGIGIAYDVSWLFPVNLRVQEAGDLKQALFGLAERLLIIG